MSAPVFQPINKPAFLQWAVLHRNTLGWSELTEYDCQEDARSAYGACVIHGGLCELRYREVSVWITWEPMGAAAGDEQP